MIDFSKWGPATVLVVLVAVIVIAVGGVVVITQPQTLTFHAYLDDLKGLAWAAAGLAGARALHTTGQAIAQRGDQTPSLSLETADQPAPINSPAQTPSGEPAIGG